MCPMVPLSSHNSLDGLFRTAVQKSLSVNGRSPLPVPAAAAAAAAAAADTVDVERYDRECAVLVERIFQRFEMSVIDAASTGQTRAVLMVFDGNDKFIDDDHHHDAVAASPLLYLIKGPRQREVRDALRRRPSVLARLRSTLVPFRISLVWDRRTNTNSLVASWLSTA
jgi:hypothetical protein